MNPISKAGFFLAVVVWLSGHSAYATDTFDYSYQFGDGTVISGSFNGVEAGNFVDNISNVSLFFDGTPIAGPIFTAQFDGTTWQYGPIVSFDALQNNFNFVNADIAGGQTNYDSYFYILNASVFADLAYAESDPLSVFSLDDPTQPGSWSLTDISIPAAVPEGGATAVILGLALVGLAWMHCRMRRYYSPLQTTNKGAGEL